LTLQLRHFLFAAYNSEAQKALKKVLQWKLLRLELRKNAQDFIKTTGQTQCFKRIPGLENRAPGFHENKRAMGTGTEHSQGQ